MTCPMIVVSAGLVVAPEPTVPFCQRTRDPLRPCQRERKREIDAFSEVLLLKALLQFRMGVLIRRKYGH